MAAWIAWNAERSWRRPALSWIGTPKVERPAGDGLVIAGIHDDRPVGVARRGPELEVLLSGDFTEGRERVPGRRRDPERRTEGKRDSGLTVKAAQPHALSQEFAPRPDNGARLPRRALPLDAVTYFVTVR